MIPLMMVLAAMVDEVVGGGTWCFEISSPITQPYSAYYNVWPHSRALPRYGDPWRSHI
jgi:hypothetical protein